MVEGHNLESNISYLFHRTNRRQSGRWSHFIDTNTQVIFWSLITVVFGHSPPSLIQSLETSHSTAWEVRESDKILWTAWIVMKFPNRRFTRASIAVISLYLPCATLLHFLVAFWCSPRHTASRCVLLSWDVFSAHQPCSEGTFEECPQTAFDPNSSGNPLELLGVHNVPTPLSGCIGPRISTVQCNS